MSASTSPSLDVSKTSIVLVIRPFSHQIDPKYNNIERFLRIGMMTYEKYLDKSSIKDFFVVVPAQDVEGVKKLLTDKHPDYPWNVINEDVLIHPAIPSGWAKQQTVKLAISMLVQTDTYLIIDDDTYLTKPFAASQLVDPDSKRLLLNTTKIDFPFFFLWSCQVLKYDFQHVQDFPIHMAITPEVFVTAVVKDIVKWLIAEYGNKKMWQIYLANHKYTEYCLYWIWLIKHDQTEVYYDTQSKHKLYGHATTGSEHSLRRQVELSFEDNANHWFSFVQSSLPHSVREIYDVVASHVRA